MTQPVQIPARLSQRMIQRHGEPAREWIAALPHLVAELAQQWKLTVFTPFEESHAYVAPALRADGSQAVLKIVRPHSEDGREVAALRLYDGRGTCRLIEADLDRWALLLERLLPGDTLVSLAQRDDDAATSVAAGVMEKLWRPVPKDGGFKHLALWFDDLDNHRAAHNGSGPLPSRLFERAASLARELLASAPKERVLHADLHHYNIISAEREPWLAIDPKGMVGDPGYEVTPFLLNPDQGEMILTKSILERRLSIFSERLAYDRARLRDWSIAHAVLTASWSIDDPSPGWRARIALAEALCEI